MGVIVPCYPLSLDHNTTQGLYWGMDLGQGFRKTFPHDTGIVADLCGQSPAGTLSATGCTIANGVFGDCLNFNGSSGYMTTTLSGGFPSTFTIAGWLNAASFSGSPIPLFVGSGSLTIDTGIYWIFNSSSSIGVNLWNDNLSLTGLSLSAGQWFHVAMTLDVNHTIRGYVNGSLVNSKSASGAYGGNGYLSLGAWASQNSNFFQGMMSNFLVFNVALPNPTIGALAANPNRIFRQRRNLAAILNRPNSGASLLLAC